MSMEDLGNKLIVHDWTPAMENVMIELGINFRVIEIEEEGELAT